MSRITIRPLFLARDHEITPNSHGWSSFPPSNLPCWIIFSNFFPFENAHFVVAMVFFHKTMLCFSSVAHVSPSLPSAQPWQLRSSSAGKDVWMTSGWWRFSQYFESGTSRAARGFAYQAIASEATELRRRLTVLQFYADSGHLFPQMGQLVKLHWSCWESESKHQSC